MSRIWTSLLASVLLSASAIAEGQVCNPDLPTATPVERFLDYGDSVADTQTGLIWKKCLEGTSGPDCSQGVPEEMTWQETLQRLAGGGWRLPNVKEAASVMDQRCHLPGLNQNVFPGTRNLIIWTSTPFNATTQDVWTQDLQEGRASTAAMDEQHGLWLVRDPLHDPLPD